jgi:flavin-binding protein dodecin
VFHHGAEGSPPIGWASCGAFILKEGLGMDSVYKVIELVGTSSESWEKAAASAVEMAAQSLRDLRIAEVTELDLQIENGQVVAYRAKVKVSFKYEREE